MVMIFLMTAILTAAEPVCHPGCQNGRCIQITTNTTACRCFNGYSGVDCRDNLTWIYWIPSHIGLLVGCLLGALLGVWVLWFRIPAKKRRRRIVLLSSIAFFCEAIYHTFTLMKNSHYQQLIYLAGQWSQGGFIFTSFFVHIQCFSFYSALARQSSLRGHPGLSRGVLILSAVALILGEFVCVRLYTTLIKVGVLDANNSFISYQLRYLIQGLVYALFSTGLIIGCMIFLVKIWRKTGFVILPTRAQQSSSTWTSFVSSDYSHPGEEVDGSLLERIRIFMWSFIGLDAVFVCFMWLDIFLLFGTDPSSWFQLIFFLAREVTLMCELYCSIWAFGGSPLDGEERLGRPEVGVSGEDSVQSRSSLSGAGSLAIFVPRPALFIPQPKAKRSRKHRTRSLSPGRGGD